MTEQQQQEQRRPIGIVTKAGRFVSMSKLDGYAMKAESRAVDDEFATFYEQQGLVAPLYNPLSLARHLELNTYHARSVYAKARDAAGLGWELLPIVENPNEAEKETIEEALEVSSEIPIQETLYRFMVDLESTGYAVLELGRDDWATEGPYTLVNHIPSHTIRVHKSRRKYAQVRTGKTVWFKRQGLDIDVHKDTGEEFNLGELPAEQRATELIFRAYYTPRSDFYGLPDHIPALGAMSGDVARRDFNIAFFDNYGVPSMMVFITGDYDPGEPDETGMTPLEQSIQQHFADLSNNPYSTLLLAIPSKNTGMPGGVSQEVKVDVEPLATEVKDASFRLFRQDNRDEVLSAHGVPRYRLGIAETGALSGNFAEESNKVYKSSIVEPRQKIIEDVMNLTVLWESMEVVDWRFALLAMDLADEAKEMEEAESLFSMGALSPNDLIRHFGSKYGVEPSDHPAMDAHYIDNEPIDLEVSSVGPEVEATLQSLHDSLIALAKKGEHEAPLADVLDMAEAVQAGRGKRRRADLPVTDDPLPETPLKTIRRRKNLNGYVAGKERRK